MKTAAVRNIEGVIKEDQGSLLRDAKILLDKFKKIDPQKIPALHYMNVVLSLGVLLKFDGPQDEIQTAKLNSLLHAFINEPNYQGTERLDYVACSKLRKFAVNIIAAFLEDRPRTEGFSLGFLDNLLKPDEAEPLNPETEAKLIKHRKEFRAAFSDKQVKELLELRGQLGEIKSLDAFYREVYSDLPELKLPTYFRVPSKQLLRTEKLPCRTPVKANKDNPAMKPPIKNFRVVAKIPAEASKEEILEIMQANSDVNVTFKPANKYESLIDSDKVKPEDKKDLAQKLYQLGRCLFLLRNRIKIKDLATLLDHIATLTKPYQADAPANAKPTIYQNAFKKELIKLAMNSAEGPMPLQCMTLHKDADYLCRSLEKILTINIKAK